MIIVPKEALDLARKFEGYSSKAYLCPAGKWTIGYGHRCEEGHADITKDEAEAYLYNDMKTACLAVNKYCPELGKLENKYAAIADFVFNLGAGNLMQSTLRKRINEGKWDTAGKEILRWIYCNGKPLKGLITRREAEYALFMQDAEK